MKINPKTIVIVFFSCTLIGVLLVFLYSLTDTTSRLGIKKTKLYNIEYKVRLDSCIKWGGTFSGQVSPNCIVNKDSNYIYLAILLEKYKAMDLKYFRNGTFCDICSDSIWTKIYADDAAEYDYLKSRYGNDFKKFVRMQAHEMNEKYHIIHYDTILTKLTQKAYKKKMTKNNIEIGVFDKTVFDSLPFELKIDTSFNKDCFSLNETKDKIILKAIHESYNQPKKYLLPEISIYFFFDSEKTDFLYFRYSFKKILVKG